jgi:uncharacterized phage protein gp47/JayE
MSSFGVTDTGFNLKLLADILSEIQAQHQADWGPEINTGAEGVIGQNDATFAAALAEAWEVLQATYRSLYPDSATGEALDSIASVTGVTREPATQSTITLTCAGTAGVLLLEGRVVSVDDTGERFVSTEPATIGGGGTVSVLFQSENYGPIQLLTGWALTIETPVAGWSGATAGEDAILGEDLETDAELRLRRLELLRFQGSATIEAIRADLLEVDGVLQAFVYENVSSVTDGRNLPPKSIECIVQGGDDTDVAEAILDTKAAGIETYGHAGQSVTKIVADSMDINHTINYTRPATAGNDIHIVVDIDINASTYPSDGDDQIKAALKALGDLQEVGQTIIYERFQAEVFAISGVVDSTAFYMDKAAPGTGTSNLTFTERELPTFATGDIDVTTTPV